VTDAGGGVERCIAGLTVRIDRLLCVGFGDCIDEAPESFALDEQGVVVFGTDADAETSTTIASPIRSSSGISSALRAPSAK